MRRLAFIGPSLPPAARRAPGIEVRPPVKHGDLFACDLSPGDAVLIVDGRYQQVPPLRHKEIMAMLDRGVHVFGAASYGALRAVELESEGMAGVGRVVRGYRDGLFSDDGDVAVLHGDDPDSLRLTVAWVSLICAEQDLRTAGTISPADLGKALRVAKDLHFTDRSEPMLLRCAADAGCHPAMSRLLDHLKNNDVKASDAQTAMAVLRALTQDARRPRVRPGAWRTSHAVETALRYTRPTGAPVSFRHMLTCLQLFRPDFPERHRRYVLRTAAASLDGEAAALTPPTSQELLERAGRGQTTLSSPLRVATRATEGWTDADRVLVRSFRLTPGRNVYSVLPPEALEGEDLERLSRLAERLVRPKDVRPAGFTWWLSCLAELWSVADDTELRFTAVDRGFRDLTEAVTLARELDHRLVHAVLAAPVGAR